MDTVAEIDPNDLIKITQKWIEDVCTDINHYWWNKRNDLKYSYSLIHIHVRKLEVSMIFIY